MKRHLATEQDTLDLGAAIARVLRAGLVLYLVGELGAGKTTLVRGILRGLGFEGRVKSPTFTLVEPYTISRLDLYHFDFYRFEKSEEWVNTGFREYFSERSVCLVEWPEKVGAFLPKPDVRIELQMAGTGRDATIIAGTRTGQECLDRLQS
jgi:tRNA threonylcarbamoyladenosine biosynthesis protein TsaE